jgi:4-amino-4-deoxy-L-arabinose transferase-like glycosyltransferase
MPKKIINFIGINRRLLFLFILVLAILLRFSGTKPGYPPYHSDEGISYSAAVSMIKNNNLDPLRYDYPAMVPLVNYLFFKFVFIPANWARFYIENFSQILDGFIKLPLEESEYRRIFQTEILGEREINALFWGRYTTALIGVGVVFLSYLLGRKIFGERAGLLSAFLVAINYRQVLNSHLGLPDIYNAFFLLLALLASYSLWKKPTSKNYLLAAIAAAFYFSTKYQLFAFLPLLLAHLYTVYNKKGFRERFKFLFSYRALAVPFIIILIFLIFNPYHFIKWEETKSWLISVSGKYRVGRNEFDFYPYSYLYHIGIGKFASVLSVLGILLALFKKPKQAFFLLSAIIPFFWVTTYFTGGGFYTRNFVTIIPLVLIFGGYLLADISNFRIKTLGILLFLVILFFTTKESLANSMVVAREYRSEWNFRKMEDWVRENIPEGSRVAAHSSVLLPVAGVERIPYNFDNGPFSLEEFRELGADYIITNLDWATASFYGWMAQDRNTSLKYWNKPVEELEKTFPAMAIREISDFAIHWELNSWQAPDSDFIAAKVPKYVLKEKSLVENYTLGKPILVKDWPGYYVSFKIKTENQAKDGKGGFVFASFYKNLDDIGLVKKRIAVRLSKRAKASGQWKEISFAGEVPSGVNYLVLEVGNYNSLQKTSLTDLRLYKVDIETDFSGVKIKGVRLDQNIIFPNSHGNL